MIKKAEIIKLLKTLVKDLVDCKYNLLENTDRIWKGTGKEIKDCVEEYPGTLTYPPESSFFEFDQYDFDSDPNGCAIDLILWVDNQKSDLTLSAEITREENGEHTIKIVSIRVL